MKDIACCLYEPSSHEELVSFFKIVDKDFVPPLSEETTVRGYVKSNIGLPGITYLAWHKEIIVGAVILHNTPVDDRCYINTIAIHPKHRRKGIGSRLIKLVTNEAQKSGHKTIHTKTWSTNQPGLKFYKKHKFVVNYIIENDRGEGIDSIYLKRDV